LPGDEKVDKYGDLMLQAHRENGKLKLVRNNSADWYYDRIQKALMPVEFRTLRAAPVGRGPRTTTNC